jgi:FeS assembly protein IscX
MSDAGDPNPLYWDSTYEIVLGLLEQHPTADLDTLGLRQVLAWVIALPGFADDPGMATDALLIEILRVWYEEKSEIS